TIDCILQIVVKKLNPESVQGLQEWQENRLKQVQEMQSNCDKGLKHMSCEAPLLGPMAEL
ncbi:hypothetical protein ACJX0J_025624, partial [Zea mays]